MAETQSIIISTASTNYELKIKAVSDDKVLMDINKLCLNLKTMERNRVYLTTMSFTDDGVKEVINLNPII